MKRKQLAEKHGIEIVNEVGLARMIEDTDARFDSETLAILNDNRKFCPKCEREMVLRDGSKGDECGQQVLGMLGIPQVPVHYFSVLVGRGEAQSCGVSGLGPHC